MFIISQAFSYDLCVCLGLNLVWIGTHELAHLMMALVLK